MRKTGSWCLIVMLLLSILSVFPIFYEIVKADPPADVYVDDDFDGSTPGWGATHFDNIQGGIDNVSSGGTVYIWDGTYYDEGIAVNKSVSLIGNETLTTHIEWADTKPLGSQPVISLEADYVNISGLHINNSAAGRAQIINNGATKGNYTNIFDCKFTNGTSEIIDISPSYYLIHHVNISNNELLGNGVNTGYAVFFQASAGNITCSNNTIRDTEGGIFIQECSGHGEVAYNDIMNTRGQDQIGLPDSSYYEVHHNTMRYGNWTGIYGDVTHNCSWYSNTIIGFNDTGCYGMELYDVYDCLIYDNYFNNDQNAYDDGENIWNISKTSGTNIIGGPYLGGNYWSDYTGDDTNHDGLGDTDLPYDSSGEIADGGDYLPLFPFANLPPNKPSNPTPTDVATNISIGTTLKVHVIDMDNDSMRVSFYWSSDTLIQEFTNEQNDTDVETSSLNLDCGTTYSWYVIANDSYSENTSDTFSFTTNNPPNITEVYPVNNSIGASRRVQCHINATDPDNDTMDVSFYENTTGIWIKQYNETVNGTVVYWNYANAKKYSTTYWWKVVVDDGVDSTTGIYHFTTRGKVSKDKKEKVRPLLTDESSPPAGISPETISIIGVLLACIILATVFVWIYYRG